MNVRKCDLYLELICGNLHFWSAFLSDVGVIDVFGYRSFHTYKYWVNIWYVENSGTKGGVNYFFPNQVDSYDWLL